MSLGTHHIDDYEEHVAPVGFRFDEYGRQIRFSPGHDLYDPHFCHCDPEVYVVYTPTTGTNEEGMGFAVIHHDQEATA